MAAQRNPSEQWRPRPGDHVSWASHGGRGRGVVQDEITERTRIRGHTVDASPEHPQYRIRNDHSGRDVAHRSQVLRPEPPPQGAAPRPGRRGTPR